MKTHFHFHDTVTGHWVTACGLKDPKVKGTWDVLRVTCVSCQKTKQFDRHAICTPRSKQGRAERAAWADAIFTGDAETQETLDQKTVNTEPDAEVRVLEHSPLDPAKVTSCSHDFPLESFFDEDNRCSKCGAGRVICPDCLHGSSKEGHVVWCHTLRGTAEYRPHLRPEAFKMNKSIFTSGYYEGLTAAFKTLESLGAKLWNEGEEDSIGVTVAAQALCRMRLVFLGGEENVQKADKVNEELIELLSKL